MSDKRDLLKAVAQDTGLTQSVIDQALRGVAKEVLIRIANGQNVRVAGLGKFSIAYRKARVGRSNMMRGQDGKGVLINIPARKALKFKPLPALIDAARGE